MKRVFISFIGALFLFVLDSDGQNQKASDSLKSILDNTASLDQKIAILKQVTYNETNPNEYLDYANELIEYSKIKRDTSGLYEGYLQKAHAYRLMGLWSESIESYHESLHYAHLAANQVNIGTSLLEISQMYFQNEKYKESTRVGLEAIEILQRTKNKRAYSVALLGLGYDYYLINRLDSALLFTKMAKRSFAALNDQSGIAYAKGNIGLIYLSKERRELAKEQLNLAIDILIELNDTYAITEYQIALAEIYLGEGNIKKSEALLLESMEYAIEDGLQERVQDASQKLSELYHLKEDYQKAFEYQTQYLVYRDSINNESAIRKIANLRAEYEIDQKQTELDLKHTEVELLKNQSKTQRIILLGVTLLVILLIAVIYLGARFIKLKERLIKISQSRRRVMIDQRNDLAELNETKDKFFSLISHDIRGPVNNFQGVAMLMKMNLEEGDTDNVKHLTELLSKSSEELSGLLDNLLEWAMSQQGRFPFNAEKLDLSETCKKTADVLINTAIAKDIELSVLSEEIYVFSDRNSTSTIIRNLVSNALKFTDPGGSITLSVTSDDEYGIVKISDTGIGIAKDKVENLFGFTGNRANWGTKGEKGVGLGLNLVQEFVIANQGKIEVESEEGVGSAFTVFLPLDKPDES